MAFDFGDKIDIREHTERQTRPGVDLDTISLPLPTNIHTFKAVLAFTCNIFTCVCLCALECRCYRVN